MTSPLDAPERRRERAAKPRSAGPRRGGLGLLLLGSGLPLLVVAVATVTGLGLSRNLPSLASVLAAVSLVVLPIAGIVAILGGRGARLAAWGSGVWVWSLSLLLVIPFYFPGERREAAGVGLDLFFEPAGSAVRESARAAGDVAIALLGREPDRLRSAVPIAEPSRSHARPAAEPDPSAGAVVARIEERLPPVPLAGDRPVVIPYDGEGNVLRIEAFFDGPRYGEEFSMIFDTGATYTTLNRESLALLEVDVPDDAPTAILRTANGEVEAPLVLVDAVWLGDAVVEWATIAVCDLCAGPEVAGLLGLNVTGQFKTSIDHTAQTIELAEPEGSEDRRLDVGQWVQFGSRVRRWRDGRVEVEVSGRNRAPTAVAEASIEIACADGSYEVEMDPIPADSTSSTRMSLPRGTDCGEYRLELRRARWRLDRF